MFPYFSTIFASILFCALGEHEGNRKKRFCALFYGLALLFPVVLAGARDFSIGTDIGAYGNYVFKSACNYAEIGRYLKTHKDIEVLYKVMAFAVSRFTDNPHWFYFLTALIICGCTMAGLLYYRRWCWLTPAWACFLLLFYGDTLNIMRQCIAAAIVFAAFPLFLEKKYVWYAAAQTAAILFHVTAILALVLPAAWLVLKLFRAKWVPFAVFLLMIAAIQLYSPVLAYCIKIHLLPAKFSRYLAGGLAFALKPTLLRLPFLLPILYFYDRFCEWKCPDREGKGGEGKHGRFYLFRTAVKTRTGLVLTREGEPEAGGVEDPAFGRLVVFVLLLEICTVQLRSILPALYRISYFFTFYRFIAYSRLVRILRRDNSLLVCAALLVYLVILWYYQNVLQGNNQIYPYLYDPGWYLRIIHFTIGE